MILFVFEGDRREPRFYETLERLYFPKDNDNIICSFGNNIYALYKEIQEYGGDGDIVSIIRQHLVERGDSTLDGYRSSDFSETYLFFDYDFQNDQLTLDDINREVKEMLLLFNEETENGKLYINYPMIESMRYTKELPDENYRNYVVNRYDCKDFKNLADKFSPYENLDYFLFKDGEKPKKDRYLDVKDNWEYLKQMNVCKANLLTTGYYRKPEKKTDVNQMSIFNSQLVKFINPKKDVAILNSFPIFIFEYMK